MNYMTEIKLFYDWLETHPLTPASIALWHGLMFIANRSGWQRELNIPISRLEANTNMPRSSIYREREKLKQAGRIDYQSRGGRASSVYVIHSLETVFVSLGETQQLFASHFVSHTDTQSETQESVVSHFVSQIEPQSENIYKLNYTESNKEKSEKESFERMEVGADAPPSLSPEDKKERKSCAKKKDKREAPQLDTDAILQTIEPPWHELMHTWLEYKRLRKESYRSEIGIRKCLTMLRNLSGNNPKTAAAIIDQSIANNWAGLFELKRQAYTPRGQPLPATGQHIGQIKQPETEEYKNRILEKFGKPKK